LNHPVIWSIRSKYRYQQILKQAIPDFMSRIAHSAKIQAMLLKEELFLFLQKNAIPEPEL